MAGLKGNCPLLNKSFRVGRLGGPAGAAPPPPNILSIAGNVASDDAAKGAPRSSLGSESNGLILLRDLKVSVEVLGAAKTAGDGEGDRR